MHQSVKIISDYLNTYYGIRVETLTFLPVGADNNASIYKAQMLDQRSYFIKLKKGDQDTSTEITDLLQSVGIQEIIPPVKTLHGKTAEHVDDFTLIVYPFIDGQDGFKRNLTDDQWIKLGKALRHLHELEVPMSIQNNIRKETYSTKWQEIVRSMYLHMEADLITDQLGLNLQKFMKENICIICRLVDRAEELGKKLRNNSPQLVLCHSDIHAGNVLMDERSNIYIVDWDDPIMAPKERDLMFIGGGVGNVWNEPLDENLFYMGYGKTEINWQAMSYYRHERIVEDIAIYSQELLLTTAGGNNRLEMYRHFIAMFEPQGVVDIAFKTDEKFSA